VFLIHHAGKSGTQRGSSKPEDTADLILGLKLPEGHMPEDGLRIEVHHEKARGIVGAAVEPFELRLMGSPTDKVVGFTWGELAGDKRVEAVAMLQAGRPVKAVAKDLDVHLATVYRWKKAMGAFA
jgi:putative DNA primase/helicase